ncbi:MAG: DUF2147 domain-containing protein [Acidovorax sp.]|uniref:DUF2147 domain-containing protein n=1 Tax=Acidovorax sp. TaxID=1872122 RepID=UPI00262A6314|nr:DUF2147 domain-containing protein [Acidovorax sp.]MDH4425112.1 DUF2147 domain-containing protein [Acidovorax sp.]
MIRTSLVIALGLTATAAMAQMSPVGLWQTVDDETGKVTSEVRIEERNGAIFGKIEKVTNPADQDSICDKCGDDRKNKKVLGLEIIRDLKKADGKDTWEGGTIVKPSTGQAFKASVTPIEGGKKLQVKGSFLFISKTQTWIRIQ